MCDLPVGRFRVLIERSPSAEAAASFVRLTEHRSDKPAYKLAYLAVPSGSEILRVHSELRPRASDQLELELDGSRAAGSGAFESVRVSGRDEKRRASSTRSPEFGCSEPHRAKCSYSQHTHTHTHTHTHPLEQTYSSRCRASPAFASLLWTHSAPAPMPVPAIVLYI